MLDFEKKGGEEGGRRRGRERGVSECIAWSFARLRIFLGMEKRYDIEYEIYIHNERHEYTRIQVWDEYDIQNMTNEKGNLVPGGINSTRNTYPVPFRLMSTCPTLE